MHLLDVNVLLAHVLEAHEHHRAVQEWLKRRSSAPLATCSLTETSLMRLLMNPAVNPDPVDAATVLELLERLHLHPLHRFITTQPGPSDPEVRALMGAVRGHRQVRDAYLVALAGLNGGKLATLDRGLEQAFGSARVEVIPV